MTNVSLLTQLEENYIKDPRKRQQYQKSVQRQYDFRIRQKAKSMLRDLKFLAEKLPEKQQSQVFTSELLLPMIGAILDPKRDGVYIHSNEPARKLRKKKIYVANERIFSLCNGLIEKAAEAGWGLMDSDFATFAAAGDISARKIAAVRKMRVFVKTQGE